MVQKIKHVCVRSLNFLFSCRYILLLAIIIFLFNLNIILNKDYGGDYSAYFLPHYHFITTSIREGIIPFWFPYNFGGLPEIFKSELAVFNPFTLFWLATNSILNRNLDISMTGNIGEVVLIAEQIFGAIGFYILISRYFSNIKIVSLIGSLIYVLNPNVSHLINTTAYLGFTILPWIILALLNYLKNQSKINLVLFVISNVLLFTGGYPYHYIYFFIVQLIIVLCVNHKKILLFLFPFGISVLLASFILLPNLHVYSQSARNNDIINHSMYSIKPSKIIQLINPLPTNNAFSIDDKQDLVSYPHFAFGTVMVILSLIGMYGIRDNKNFYWVILLLVLFVIYSIGGYINAIELFSILIPVLSKFRTHAQGIVVINLCISIFAVCGLQSLFPPVKADWQKIKASILFLIGISLVFTMFYLLQNNENNKLELYSWSRNCLFLLIISFVLFLSKNFNHRISILLGLLFIFESYFLYSINPHIADYKYRDFFNENNLIIEEMKNPLKRVYVEGNQFVYNLAHLGIYQDAGYEALPYKGWYDFSAKHYGIQRLGKKNVEFVISTNPNLNTDNPNMEKLSTYSKSQLGGAGISDYNGLPYYSIHSNNSYSIYKIANTTPRYFAPKQITSCTHTSCINEDSFPDNVVYNGKESFTYGEIDLTVTPLEYSANKVILKVISDKDAYLASSDIYDKGWKAYVNNSPTKVYLTSGAYRGIFINQGENLVEFRYYPSLLNAGITTSLVTLVLLFILLITNLWLVIFRLNDKLLLFIERQVNYVKAIKPI